MEKHNLTNIGKRDDDHAHLKADIALLRQLNDELQDKNDLLKKLTIKYKEDKSSLTYSDAIKNIFQL